MSYGSPQPDLRSKAVSPKRSLSDIRSKAVSPDRWRDPGLLFRRDSESSMASSYHSTPTNGSPQIRPSIFEPFNRVFSPYPESSATSSSALFTLAEVPDTPVSTLGQFGDLVQPSQNPSASELVQKVHQSWRSQSRDEQHGTHHSQSHSRTRSGRHHSQSRSRSEHRRGREVQDLREVLENPESREPSLGRGSTQQSSNTRNNRERSHSRSTVQAGPEVTREPRERSQSTAAVRASLKDIERTREDEKERQKGLERARQRDRSQSTHRRGASSRELRLLVHERSYDNDREIATEKVKRFLQSLESSAQSSMTSPTSGSITLPPIPRFAASETSQSMASQQTPTSTRPQTPQSMASHTTQSTTTQSQTPDQDKELILENRGLYQRVAALQRTERDLLAENQELVRQLAILKKHQETRRQQWEDELQSVKEREKILLVEAQQLKAQIMRQEEQIMDLTSMPSSNSQLAPAPQSSAGLLPDQDIKAWFSERDEIWYAWARDYASRDPNRLSTGLHPLQLHELCDGVKDFVKLTEDHQLPSELMVGSTDMVQTLLHGIFANFICAEALSSPFWVFNAISSGSPESPYVSPPTAISPGGFRLDHALLNAIPSRNVYFPSAQQARMPLSLVTTNLPPSSHHHDPISASSLAYPMKAEMENMFHMLTKGSHDDTNPSSPPSPSPSPSHVKALLFHLFATSGISLPPSSSSSSSSSSSPLEINETKRTLIESRLNYARRLKDRFLAGVARFLLQDQDPAGIAHLERSLTEHIDDALRFSCQLWAKSGPGEGQGKIRFHAPGFAALGGQGQVYKAGGRLVELCWAQQQTLREHDQGGMHVGLRTARPHGDFDGREVVMVVQPGVECLDSGAGLDKEKKSRVWLKARVLVAAKTKEEGLTPTTAQGQEKGHSGQELACSNTSSSVTEARAGSTVAGKQRWTEIPADTFREGHLQQSVGS
ncbi:hypothetical protein B0T20DRAFT_103318 [Sordaria brevicollis]|uniref:Uncharacterized protein n=1 Tax=Sordaria brevicollis TaxID=83679 RepID=A0AAE0NV60_SORBR|nr:hypothetical protein B0T20DRAFT_103318 [Sordaria brevicollis]